MIVLDPIARMMLPVALKTAVLLCSALVLLHLLRRGAATLRAFVCVLALAGAVLLPILSLWQPDSLGFIFTVPVWTQSSGTVAHAGHGRGFPAAGVLAMIWLGGALVLSIRYAAGYLAVHRLTRTASAANADWRSDFESLCAGTHARIAVAEVASPITCGLFRSTILIPASAGNWPGLRRRSVLLHELAHVQHHDLASNLLAAAATALLWFQPLVWMLAARLRTEQEFACDDAVLQAGVVSHSYAEVLLESAQSPGARVLFGCAMTGTSGRAAFSSRLNRVLDTSCPRVTRRRVLQRTTAGFALLLLTLAMIRPIAAQEVHKIGNGVTAPKVIQKTEPKYTDEARDAHISGSVLLSLVVDAQGKPRDIRVERSLDPGLDKNAVTAVESWLFAPGTLKGKPVDVQARIEVNFRLQ